MADPYALTYSNRIDQETNFFVFPDRYAPEGTRSVKNVRTNYVSLSKRGVRTPFSFYRPFTNYKSVISSEGWTSGGETISTRDLYDVKKPFYGGFVYAADKKGNVRLKKSFMGMRYPERLTTSPKMVPTPLIPVSRYDTKGTKIGEGEGIFPQPNSSQFKSLLSPNDLLEVRYYATMNMMKNIGHRKASFGIALAESHQTFAMLGNAFRSLRRAYLLTRKGRIRDAAEVILLSLSPQDQRNFRRSKGFKLAKNYASATANETFSSWLAIQFGWLQLLNDISDLNEVFKNIKELSDLPRVSGFGFSSIENEHIEPWTSVLNCGTARTSFFRGSALHSHSIKGYAKSDYAIGNLNWFLLESFGLANPFELAWDALPYSFVLDWFVPISNSLASLSATTGLTKLNSSISIREEQRLHVSIPAGASSSYRYTIHQPFSGLARRLKLDRQADFPAKPILLAPPVRYPKSLWHAMTGIALISQRF